ncbi:MAG: chorismate synthase [Clostridiales bacterium]|nr:chorismate synthase [Clostridiales bacterium]
MSSNYGNRIKLQIFGQSHSKAIGAVLDGLPAGEEISLEQVERFMERRAPGKNRHSTPRSETDKPIILSGLVDNRTCGAPIAVIIENNDTRSSDYDQLRRLPRPSHADYTAHIKYGGFSDIRGGGHFSGRLTAPLCFAGALCLQLLERRNIYIGAHIASIGDISDTPYNPVSITKEQLQTAGKKKFPTNDDTAGAAMTTEIEAARLSLDSVGGVIECCIIGLPPGLGEPMFDGIENKIASMIFGIPAVKGIEFGSGFACAKMRGSEHNDPMYYAGNKVKTKTNHAGGIVGGITNGMPVIFRVAIKPTSSIAQKQETVDLETGENTTLSIKGRHDPCIVPRAVPCIEAGAALAIADLLF